MQPDSQQSLTHSFSPPVSSQTSHNLQPLLFQQHRAAPSHPNVLSLKQTLCHAAGICHQTVAVSVSKAHHCKETSHRRETRGLCKQSQARVPGQRQGFLHGTAGGKELDHVARIISSLTLTRGLGPPGRAGTNTTYKS